MLAVKQAQENVFLEENDVSVDSAYERGFDSSSESENNHGHFDSISDTDAIGTVSPTPPKPPIISKPTDPLISPPPPLFFERLESEGWVVTENSEDTLPKSGTSLQLKHPPPQFQAISTEDEPFTEPWISTATEPTVQKQRNISSSGYPECVPGKLVYDCFSLNAQRRVVRNDSAPFYKLSNEADTTLIFDSLFESGNLYQGKLQIISFSQPRKISPLYSFSSDLSFFNL